MNANELAERLDNMEPYLLDDLPVLEEAADMLMKQQAEIEALKANFNKENLVKEVFNTEPVACIQDLNEVKRKQLVYEQGMDWKDPLYTHPAKTLTLTDDEVEEFEWVLKKHFNFPTNEIVPNLDKIIRAILRKAQEK